MRNKVSLKDLLVDTVEEMNHLEKAKELLFQMYFEADGNLGTVSYETLRIVHEYLGFDKGEDE
jgi:hypothetical protein